MSINTKRGYVVVNEFPTNEGIVLKFYKNGMFVGKTNMEDTYESEKDMFIDSFLAWENR